MTWILAVCLLKAFSNGNGGVIWTDQPGAQAVLRDQALLTAFACCFDVSLAMSAHLTLTSVKAKGASLHLTDEMEPSAWS